jgi:hypothetical protein
LTPTGDWRVVVERSSMINNAESYFRMAPDKIEEFTALIWDKRKWKVRATRPLFQEEIDQGLPTDTQYTDDRVWDDPETHPPLTNALDALYKLHRQLDFHVGLLDNDPVESLIHYLAYSYYDCMSGGCSSYALAVIAHLFVTLDVDRSLQVYPGKDGNVEAWHTVGDFLDEIANSAAEGRPLPDLSMLNLESP